MERNHFNNWHKIIRLYENMATSNPMCMKRAPVKAFSRVRCYANIQHKSPVDLNLTLKIIFSVRIWYKLKK